MIDPLELGFAPKSPTLDDVWATKTELSTSDSVQSLDRVLRPFSDGSLPYLCDHDAYSSWALPLKIVFSSCIAATIETITDRIQVRHTPEVVHYWR